MVLKLQKKFVEIQKDLLLLFSTKVLDRADEGIDAAEKAVVAYGGVQMGQLEKNVSWISLFIALHQCLVSWVL